MEKLKVLFKLGLKFYNKFFKSYFKLMLKIISIAIIGFIPFILTLTTPSILFSILSMVITIPCFCYSFWRGFVITYSLNIAAYGFIKGNSSINLEDCYRMALKKEKDFASYVIFTGIITILCYIPTLFVFLKNINITNLTSTYDVGIFIPVLKVGAINTLVLMPFLNYATQAYFFRENESFFQLFLNCYKKLDSTGFLVALIITTLSFFISQLLIVYVFVFMIMNVFVYAINTFWYYSKVPSFKVKD